MATMIPSWLPVDVVVGEKRVFDELKSDPISKDWIILHSYCLSKHLYQERGEIDFVVIAPGLGVMVVEVKSHRSVRFDGLWHLGMDPPDAKGPLKQAMNNMYSIRNLITESGRMVPAIDYCVVFPFATFSQSSPEWHDWQIVDRHKGESRGFAASIKAALVGHLSHSGQTPEVMKGVFTPSNAASLANFLRPKFDAPESLAFRNSELNREYKTFLDEQFEALDQLDDHSEMLFEGAAGTGKTLLALETARRSILSGKRVLMLCFNRQLAKYLVHDLGNHDALAFCGTVASYMSRIAGKVGETIDFSELTESAISSLVNTPKSSLQYDVLIVDEVQDIANTESMDFLELLIDYAGIKELRFFGDFDFQKVFFNQKDARVSFINRFPSLNTFRLWSNCRNRPEFGNLITSLCEFDNMYKRFRLPSVGSVFSYIPFENERQKIQSIEGVLEELLKNFIPGEIVILGEHQFDDQGTFSQSMEGRFYGNEDPPSVRKKILSTTIRKFKGLEAKAVIIHDFHVDMNSELLYAGISRAIESIVLVGPKSENIRVATKLLPKV